MAIPWVSWPAEAEAKFSAIGQQKANASLGQPSAGSPSSHTRTVGSAGDPSVVSEGLYPLVEGMLCHRLVVLDGRSLWTVQALAEIVLGLVQVLDQQAAGPAQAQADESR